MAECIPQMKDDLELYVHMMEQRETYKALAKQATKVANKVKARTTYNEKYANDPDFRKREKERMLIAYYLKKEEKEAAVAVPPTELKAQ